MRLYSAPLPGSPAGSGDPQQLPPHSRDLSPLHSQPRAGPVGIIISPGWLVVVAQISALSIKRVCFIREGICLFCLLPLGQDNEVLLDTKQQINTRYSRRRNRNIIPNPQLGVGVDSESICCCCCWDRFEAIKS